MKKKLSDIARSTPSGFVEKQLKRQRNEKLYKRRIDFAFDSYLKYGSLWIESRKKEDKEMSIMYAAKMEKAIRVMRYYLDK